jgi:hypothetical protein
VCRHIAPLSPPVRSATAGVPPDETATAPYARRRWLLSHNGVADRPIPGHRLVDVAGGMVTVTDLEA